MQIEPLKLIESAGAVALALFFAWYLGTKVDKLSDRVQAVTDKLIEFMSKFARVVVLLLIPLAMLGCSALPPVQFCFVHPKYGRACVGWDGKLFIDVSLSDAERDEVEAWVKAQIEKSE